MAAWLSTVPCRHGTNLRTFPICKSPPNLPLQWHAHFVCGITRESYVSKLKLDVSPFVNSVASPHDRHNFNLVPLRSNSELASSKRAFNVRTSTGWSVDLIPVLSFLYRSQLSPPTQNHRQRQTFGSPSRHYGPKLKREWISRSSQTTTSQIL